MKRVFLVALALWMSGCDCSSAPNMDGGQGGGSGGGGGASGGGSAGGGSSAGGGAGASGGGSAGGGTAGGGAGGGASDSGSGCQWTLTGELNLSGTCGPEALTAYRLSTNTFAVEVDTDSDATIGVFMFAAQKTGLLMPAAFDSTSASAYGGTLIRQADSAAWVVSNSPAVGSFAVAFSDPGTSQSIGDGNKFVNTHGTIDATLIPGPGASNPATGNEAFHASW